MTKNNKSSVAYDEALKRTRANPYSTWAKSHERLQPEAWPFIQPSFQIAPGSTIFTIGSCFARNIEEHLHRLGYDVPTYRFTVPSSERLFTGNGVLNKYTPPSMLEVVKWAASIYRRDGCVVERDSEIYAYKLPDGTVIDNNLPEGTPVTMGRFIERRRQFYDLYRSLFSADVVVLTPGVAEAWYDTDRGIYIDHVFLRRIPEITQNHRFELLDFESSFACLDQTISTIFDLNPGCKILITTSPVPLGTTFSGMDIIVANMHAKSILRAACGAVAAKWDGVDYFPSFESVQLTRSWDVFQKDLLHVRDEFVGKIVARLTEAYCIDTGEAENLYRRSLEETDIELSLQYMRTAVELSPQTADYHSRLGSLLAEKGELTEAVDALAKAITLSAENEKYCEHLFDIADKYKSAGNIPSAQQTLLLVTQLVPDWHKPFEVLGAFLEESGDIAGAEQAFRRAVEIMPTKVGSIFRLGKVLNRLKRPEEAKTLLESILPQATDFPMIDIQFGIALLQTNHIEDAEKAFMRVIEQNPDNKMANKYLAELRTSPKYKKFARNG